MNRTSDSSAFCGSGARTGSVLLALTVLLSGCSSSTEPLLTLWEGNLSAVPPARVTGQAAAVTQLGRTEVNLQIRRADPETVYRWQVVDGSCQQDGGVKDGPAVYGPLDTDEGGSAEQSTTLTSLFRPGDQLSVKVYGSDGAGGEELVSCGALQEK